MIASIAGVALALAGTTRPPAESIPGQNTVPHGRSPPLTADLDERDDKCCPNGLVPHQFSIGPGRSHAVRRCRDIRDGLCYPNGAVPRQYQEGRQGYHYRRNGYFEMR